MPKDTHSHKHSEFNFSKHYGTTVELLIGLSDREIDSLLNLGIQPSRYVKRSKLTSLTAKNRRLKALIKKLTVSMGAHWSDAEAERLSQLTIEYRERLQEIHWLQFLLNYKDCPGYRGNNSETLN